ncbi:hypothetical protein F2Q68_00012625 [Brassica cretica]|uniref:Uncharacterized protein n=1 Tax=Brassica cretica TaxID=69181 RepID=A0A8S9KW70_BRACR|nr:hypothetical protein F2Q68_00012625 [Brassica cretica]
MLLARVIWRLIGLGDAPRRLGCNCGGALVVLAAKKRRRSGAPCRLDCNDAGGQAISVAALLFPLYQTSRCLIKAEQANGGYDVELSDGFDDGEKFGDGDLLVF